MCVTGNDMFRAEGVTFDCECKHYENTPIQID